MDLEKTPLPPKPKPRVSYRDGRLYIPQALERKLFFALTVAMMLWGLLAKTGLL